MEIAFLFGCRKGENISLGGFMRRFISKAILQGVAIGFFLSPTMGHSMTLVDSFSITKEALHVEAVNLCAAIATAGPSENLADKVNGCIEAFLDCQTGTGGCVVEDPANPDQLSCSGERRSLCERKRILGAGRIAIEPSKRNEFTNKAMNKCELLVKNNEGCQEAKNTCTRQFLQCAEAEPFSCFFVDEEGMIACKQDPTTANEFCDNAVIAKLPSLIPQACIGTVLKSQESPPSQNTTENPSQTPSESPVGNPKGVLAGSGCTLNPTGAGPSIAASLVFLLGLIPVIFRIKRTK